MLSPPRQPGKRYPVFFFVYGGPHGQQVTDAWYGALPLHEALVDQGWIVFTIDNRGTNRAGRSSRAQSIARWAMPRCRTSWPASNG
jgi:dipeptidyl-peptidase-4